MPAIDSAHVDAILAAPIEPTDKLVLLRLLVRRGTDTSLAGDVTFYNADEASALGLARSTYGRVLRRLAERGYFTYQPGVGRASSKVTFPHATTMPWAS